MNNSLQPKTQKPKFSAVISDERYQKLIQNTLGDPDRARRFVASISSAVGTNPALQECEGATIITAALLGESLNLSPSPQLGQYYLVPYRRKYKDAETGQWVELPPTAQFQMGYKGYIQLALRSGYYKKIIVLPVKQGEFKGYNPFEEECFFEYIKDPEIRLKAPTVGYYAMFEYTNGFRKVLYWTREQMEHHADTYSQVFKLTDYKRLQSGGVDPKEMYKYSSFWYKSFDDMACKTMLRQLISKWGMLSIEMRDAYLNDGAVIHAKDNSETLFECEVESPENEGEYTSAPLEVAEPPQVTAPVVENDPLA